MRAIHEIRTSEPLCDDHIGAHRDVSILNGTIVNEMPVIDAETGSLESFDDEYESNKEISLIEIPNHKVWFMIER